MLQVFGDGISEKTRASAKLAKDCFKLLKGKIKLESGAFFSLKYIYIIELSEVSICKAEIRVIRLVKKQFLLPNFNYFAIALSRS